MAFFDKLDQLAGIDPNSTFGSALNQMTGNVQQPAAQAPVTNAPVAPQAQPVEQAQPQPQMQPAMAAQPMAPVNPTQMGPTQAAAMGQQPANPLNQPVGPMPQAMAPAPQARAAGPIQPVSTTMQPGGAQPIPTAVAPAQDPVYQRMLNVESGNKDYQPNGQPVTSSAGAMYAAQVMPATAHNPGFGIQPVTAETPSEYDRVGREYHQKMREKYGDEEKAAAAYNAGPGRVDRAVKLAEQHGGDWRSYLPAETKQYLAKVNPNAAIHQVSAVNRAAEQETPEIKTTGNQEHDELIAAGNDPQRLVSIAMDNTGKYSDATRKAANQTMLDMLGHGHGMEQAKNELTAAAQNGNILPVVNKAARNTPEGSRFRAMLYELAGAKQAAADEYNKLGVGSTWQPGLMMGADNKLQRYAVYMSPDGQAKRVIDSTTGQEITDPKILSSLNGGGMGGMGLKSGGLRQGATTGNTYEVMTDKNGNTFYRDPKTGALSPTLSENLVNVGSKTLTRLEQEQAQKVKNKFVADNDTLATKSGGWNHHPTFGSRQEMLDAAEQQYQGMLSGTTKIPAAEVAQGPIPTEPAVAKPGEAAAPVAPNAAPAAKPETAKGAVRPYDANDFIDRYAMDAMNGKAPMPSMSSSGLNPQQRAAVEKRIGELSQQTGTTVDRNAFKATQGANVANEKAFATGQQGNAVRSMNTAIDHMDTLREQIKKLPNGQYPAINDIITNYARATGDSRINSYDAAAGLIAAEVTKAIVANGGTGNEREEKEKLLSVRNNPEALRGVLNSYTQLLGGQLHELKGQYEANGGKNWDPKVSNRTMYAISESNIHRQLSDQDRQAIDWARNNAKDPRAETIRKRLGL